MTTERVTVNRTTLTGIANAIRTKSGSQELYKPSEMAAAISGIQGGGTTPVESVTISNKADLAQVWLETPYASLPLTISVLPADAPQFVNIVSSDSSVIGVRRNDDGSYVVRPYKPGTATITVSDYSGDVTDSVAITVGKHLTGIQMASSTLELVVGVSRKLDVNLTPNWATDAVLAWSSSDPESVSVDQNGNVTAHKHCEGIVVTATARGGTLTTSCTIKAYVYEDEPDWDTYRQQLKNNTLSLQVGDVIAMPWSDKSNKNKEYTFQWRIVHTGTFEVEGGATKKGMVLMAVDSLPFSTPFNHGRRLVADEETAQSGIAYYGVTGSTFTKLELLEGDPIPYDQYTNVYKTDLISDKMTGSLFSSMTGNGLNRWETSALRQFLNSDADPNNWYNRPYLSDNCSYANRYGFLSGFSPAFIAALAKVKVQTSRNTAIFNGEIDTTHDRMFLPSASQVGLSSSYAADATKEGEKWAYYEGLSNNDRRIKPLGSTSFSSAWLRSASLTYTYAECIIYSSGALNYGGSYDSAYAAPACVIVESD